MRYFGTPVESSILRACYKIRTYHDNHVNNHATRFNLKTEIRNGQMSQHVGAQTHWKKRSDIGTNLARFFQCVCAQEVVADGHFQFRFSGLTLARLLGYKPFSKRRGRRMKKASGRQDLNCTTYGVV
jgi:hypothetical protein